jgi:hypothetical protein
MSEKIQSKSVVTTAGLGSKTITDVIVTEHGSVTVVEVTENSVSHFIKFKQGVLEVGGTIDWDSGTKVTLPSR